MSIKEDVDQINNLLDELKTLNDKIVKYRSWAMTALPI